MKIIAIHDGHTASAAYMEDGFVKFAIQEERLAKIKNAGGFPKLSIQEILKRHKLDIKNVDYFVFCDTESKPWGLDSRKSVLAKYGKLFNTEDHQLFYQKYFSFFKKIIKTAIKKIISYDPKKNKEVDRNDRAETLIKLGVSKEKITFLDHHLCHASAASYGWGKPDRFMVITSDSAGDGNSGSVSIFENGNLERKAVIELGDSVARIYSLLTYYMGMIPMEHEYKLMGLAAYVEDSKMAQDIANYLYDLFEFNEDGLTYQRKKGVEPVYLFGARLKKYLAYKRFDIVSAGLQLFIEKLATEWVRRAAVTLGVKDVALSGGLFMNVKLNKIISELKEIDSIFIFPSCGDESNVFGALYYRYHELTNKMPVPLADYYMGGDFSEQEIENSIKKYRFQSSKIKCEKIKDMPYNIAKLLADKEIVARFNGRMEFGARALGNRSILANPTDHNSIKIINKMIKSRDFWMPFAPSLTDCGDYLINPKKISSPYMMLAFDVNKQKIPAMHSALHSYDNTCRPQEVVEKWNPVYYNTIKEFKKLTGESVILNTSFNLHGFPIVYTPEDALYVFDNSGLRYLALGDYLIQKIS